MITQRLLLFFQLLFLLVFGTVFYFLLHNYDEAEAMQRVEYALYQYQAIQAYNDKFQKEAINELKDKGVLPKHFFNVELMSSSYMSRQVHEEYVSLLKYNAADGEEKFKLKFASKNPLNPLNKVDEFENSLLEQMQKEGTTTLNTIASINDEEMFVYAKIEHTTRSCLQCHGDPANAPDELIKRYGTTSGFNEKVGDLRGVLLIYTPVHFHDKDRHVFFFTVIAFVVLILVLIYFMMKYYAKELKKRDTLLAEQSQFAFLGEIGALVVDQWREPLSQISTRLDNMILDHELNTVDNTRQEERLVQSRDLLLTFANSIESFRRLYDTSNKLVCVYPTRVVDTAISVLFAQSNTNHITYVKMYDTLSSVMLRENILYIVSVQLLKELIDLSKTYASDGMTININISKAQTVQIRFSTNIILAKESQKEFLENRRSGVVAASSFVQKQMQGTFTTTLSNNSIVFTLELPYEKCKNI